MLTRDEMKRVFNRILSDLDHPDMDINHDPEDDNNHERFALIGPGQAWQMQVRTQRGLPSTVFLHNLDFSLPGDMTKQLIEILRKKAKDEETKVARTKAKVALDKLFGPKNGIEKATERL